MNLYKITAKPDVLSRRELLEYMEGTSKADVRRRIKPVLRHRVVIEKVPSELDVGEDGKFKLVPKKRKR